MEYTPLLLASASPRRREILTAAGFRYDVCPAALDERIAPGISPREAAALLAQQKARAVAASHPNRVVLGADTVVAVDSLLLGKPKDAADAARMLSLLSGRGHVVCTGVSICGLGRETTFSCETRVLFDTLDDAVIHQYIATDEPMDKAGAYGIQGQGSLLVREIAGDYFNVMGLPIHETARALASFDVLPDWQSQG